jgi:hypothetical protein
MLVVRVSGLVSGIYVFSSCEGKFGEAASGLVVVTVEKAVGEGGIPAARRVVGEADLMVPTAGKSTLFFLMRTHPAAFLHLSSPCSSFLSLPQIHGYQGTKVSLLQK